MILTFSIWGGQFDNSEGNILCLEILQVKVIAVIMVMVQSGVVGPGSCCVRVMSV